MSSSNPYETPTDDLPTDSPNHMPANARSVKWGRLVLGACAAALLIALVVPITRRGARPAAYRMQCSNNLQQIALALLAYEAAYKSFPPATTVGDSGQRLHSWRTLLLPFLEQQSLYASIDLSKPWDDPVNAAARESSPNVFHCPTSDVPLGFTTYMAVVSPDAFFHPTAPRQASEITDNRAETLMVLEVSDEEAVHWMAPQDLDMRSYLTFNDDTESAHRGGTNAAFADGSIRFLPAELSEDYRRAILSIAGNDSISGDAQP